jgi:hypothetical protein
MHTSGGEIHTAPVIAGHVLCQGTTSEAAERLFVEPVLCQGTTSEAAEKLFVEPVLCQGMTSVVPQRTQIQHGL